VRLDLLAGEVQFVHHLAPVAHALGDRLGDFIVWDSPHSIQSRETVLDTARGLGLRPVLQPSAKRPTLVASYGDQRFARTFARRIARLEHGIGQSFVTSTHPSYAGGRDADDVSLFLTPNEHSADRWRRAYPQTSVAVVGCPKLDTLPHREPGPGPVIGVSFHWGRPGRKTHPENESRGSWSEYARGVLDLATRYSVIGTGHPKAIERMASLYSFRKVPVLRDFNEVQRQSDVLVCDTNSALYEFASTGRPVVVVNGRHFRRDVVHGLRFDWGPATNVGVQCDRPLDLPRSVALAIQDTPAQRAARERALDIVYAYRSGAAERAAAALISWMSQVAVAA
jgi:hypothetical protein